MSGELDMTPPRNSRVVEPAQHKVQDAVILDVPWPFDPASDTPKQDELALANHLAISQQHRNESTSTLHQLLPTSSSSPSLQDPLAPAPVHHPSAISSIIPVAVSASAPPAPSTSTDTDLSVQDLLRFPRTHSMPPPSQLGDLQHPHQRSAFSSSTLAAIQRHQEYRELSLELADAVQTVVQTMLQISPPQLLDSTKEQISPCSLSIPSPSMSAIFTAMKNLNYISANMATMFNCSRTQLARQQQQPQRSQPYYHRDSASSSMDSSANVWADFDIAEMLQSVGDLMSGTAAQAGVDLVLYHADVDLKHVCVKGNESSIQYLLTHVLRQILATANRNDSIEIGLYVQPKAKPKTTKTTAAGTANAGAAETEMARSTGTSANANANARTNAKSTESSPEGLPNSSRGYQQRIPKDYQGPVECTFRIEHVFAQGSDESRRSSPSPSASPSSSASPSHSPSPSPSPFPSSASSTTSSSSRHEGSRGEMGDANATTTTPARGRHRHERGRGHGHGQRRKLPALSTDVLRRLLYQNEATLITGNGEECCFDGMMKSKTAGRTRAVEDGAGAGDSGSGSGSGGGDSGSEGGDGRAWELGLTLETRSSNSASTSSSSASSPTSSVDEGSDKTQDTSSAEGKDKDKDADERRNCSGEDPSLDQLTGFIDALKGKRATLYADPEGSFGKRTKSYLAAWGMEVQVRPPSSDLEAEPPPVPPSSKSGSSSGSSTPGASAPAPAATATATSTSTSGTLNGISQQQQPQGPAGNGQQAAPPASQQPTLSFVLIDDDVDTLRARLRVQRAELPANLRKRPSMAAHHRPRSYSSQPQPGAGAGASSSANGGSGSNPSNPSGSSSSASSTSSGTPVPNSPPPPPPSSSSLSSTSTPTSVPLPALPPVPAPPHFPLIIHFTSLENYKAAKDVTVQFIPSLFAGTKYSPEVMVIPKPIGPRRLLTALYMHVETYSVGVGAGVGVGGGESMGSGSPNIDPLFLPTGTAPRSGKPDVQYASGLLQHGHGHGHGHEHGRHGSLSEGVGSPKSPTGRLGGRVQGMRMGLDGSGKGMQNMGGGGSGVNGLPASTHPASSGAGGVSTPGGSSSTGSVHSQSQNQNQTGGGGNGPSTPAASGSGSASGSSSGAGQGQSHNRLFVNLSSSTNNASEMYQQLVQHWERQKQQQQQHGAGLVNSQKAIVLPSPALPVGVGVRAMSPGVIRAGGDGEASGSGRLGFDGSDGYFGSVSSAVVSVDGEGSGDPARAGEKVDGAGPNGSIVGGTPTGMGTPGGNATIESLLLAAGGGSGVDWANPPAEMMQLMLGSTAASGAMLQDANGRHLGIYFQPKFRKPVTTYEEKRRRERERILQMQQQQQMLQQQQQQQQEGRRVDPTFVTPTTTIPGRGRPTLPPGVVQVGGGRRRKDHHHHHSHSHHQGGGGYASEESDDAQSHTPRVGSMSFTRAGGRLLGPRQGPRSAAAGWATGDSDGDGEGDGGLSSASPTPRISSMPMPPSLMSVLNSGSLESPASATAEVASGGSVLPESSVLERSTSSPPQLSTPSTSAATKPTPPKFVTTGQASSSLAQKFTSAAPSSISPPVAPTPVSKISSAPGQVESTTSQTTPAPISTPTPVLTSVSTSITTTKVQQELQTPSQPTPIQPSVSTSAATTGTSNTTAGASGSTSTVMQRPLTGPAAAAAALANRPKQTAEPPKIVPPVRVLIVDDNPINQNILSTFMKRKKIKYDVASNGQEAVEKWKGGGFHLILMDIQMPIMDGIDATKEIRRLERDDPLAGLPPTAPARLALGEQYQQLQQQEQQQKAQQEHVLGTEARRETTRQPPAGPLLPNPVPRSRQQTQGQADNDNGGNNSNDNSSPSVSGISHVNAGPNAKANGANGTVEPLPAYRSSVIIVALTASSLQSDRVAALAAGCNDFLTKPVSLLWLNNKIIEWGSIKALQMWGEHRPGGRIWAQVQARNNMLAQQQQHASQGLIASGSSIGMDQDGERKGREGQAGIGSSGAGSVTGPGSSAVPEEPPRVMISAAAAASFAAAAAVRAEMQFGLEQRRLRKQQQLQNYQQYLQQESQYHHQHHSPGSSHAHGQLEQGPSSERSTEPTQSNESSSQTDLYGPENGSAQMQRRRLRRERIRRQRERQRERGKEREKGKEREQAGQIDLAQTEKGGSEPDAHVEGDRHVEAEVEAESSRQAKRRDLEREHKRKEKRRQRQFAREQIKEGEATVADDVEERHDESGRQKKRKGKEKEKLRERGEEKEKRKRKGKGRQRDQEITNTSTTSSMTIATVAVGTGNTEPGSAPGAMAFSTPPTPLRVTFAAEVTMLDTDSRETKGPMAGPGPGPDLGTDGDAPRSGQSSNPSILRTGDSAGSESNQNHRPPTKGKAKMVRIGIGNEVTPLRNRPSHTENGTAHPTLDTSIAAIANGNGEVYSNGDANGVEQEEGDVKKKGDEKENGQEKREENTRVDACGQKGKQQEDDVVEGPSDGRHNNEDNAVVDRGPDLQH